MLKLRKAKIEDFEKYYQIRCSSYINIWAGYSHNPLKDVLYDSFIKRLESRILFIISSDIPIGFVYLTINSKEIELNYAFITKEIHRKVGKDAIKLIKRYIKQHYKNHILWSWIIEEQEERLQEFIENGFYKINQTREVFLPLKEKDYIQYRYEWRNGN